MNQTPQIGTSLPYDEFWRWLREHPNCIVEAGTASATLVDFDDFHWTFSEEEDGRSVVQLVRGKNLVGEVLVHPADVLFVQASPDLESADRGQWMFEAMGGSREEPFVVAYFVMSHGIEDLAKHRVFKH